MRTAYKLGKTTAAIEHRFWNKLQTWLSIYVSFERISLEETHPNRNNRKKCRKPCTTESTLRTVRQRIRKLNQSRNQPRYLERRHPWRHLAFDAEFQATSSRTRPDRRWQTRWQRQPQWHHLRCLAWPRAEERECRACPWK